MLQHRECMVCINNDLNPTVTIGDDGVCNICRDYMEHFDPNVLHNELQFLKKYIRAGEVDCMVGLSGGKDSTSMLIDVIEHGFHPVCFTLDLGYNRLSSDVLKNIMYITKKLGVDYEVINARQYITEFDLSCFREMSHIYKRAEENSITTEEFTRLYTEGRKYYSTKDNTVFPFVRPCQICRKIAIRAFYGEAIKRNINIVFLGINEWASKFESKYSAIRRLQPNKDYSEVYIVHMPYLLQKKYQDVVVSFASMPKLKSTIETQVKTGGNSCQLAEICEPLAFKLMGFHLDSLRLSREVTVGFIDKITANAAVQNFKNTRPVKNVQELLTECHIL